MKLEALNELCPMCGNFVSSLNDTTGFCEECTPTVELSKKKDTKLIRENWYKINASKIESVMVDYNFGARFAIKVVMAQNAVTCLCCGEFIPHATPGRHFLCNKNPQCKKARRYYKYLMYEKGIEQEEALKAALLKFKE